MNVEDMTKDERSLLLYFEDCMVNRMGCVQPVHMNEGDFEIAERWHRDKFVSFVRCPYAFIRKDNPNRRAGGDYTHLVLLSDGAWKVAHQLREDRGNRQFSNLIEKRVNGKLLVPAIEKAMDNLGLTVSSECAEARRIE